MFWADSKGEKYRAHHETEGIYDRFLADLFTLAEDVFANQYLPVMTAEHTDEKALIRALKHKKNKCTVSLFAHNGHKADYPLVEKALLNSTLFRLESQCASGMAKISYTWKVLGKYEEI